MAGVAFPGLMAAILALLSVHALAIDPVLTALGFAGVASWLLAMRDA